MPTPVCTCQCGRADAHAHTSIPGPAPFPTPVPEQHGLSSSLLFIETSHCRKGREQEGEGSGNNGGSGQWGRAGQENGRAWAAGRVRARWGVQRPVAKLLHWPGLGWGAPVVVEIPPPSSQKTVSYEHRCTQGPPQGACGAQRQARTWLGVVSGGQGKEGLLPSVGAQVQFTRLQRDRSHTIVITVIIANIY